MRIIALIDDIDVVERILKHLRFWHPRTENSATADPCPPRPEDETIPLTYLRIPNIA
jgi:hypothetical protein